MLLPPTTRILFSFHPLGLSPLDFIYAHAPFQLCDGFSAAMLNFTGHSIPFSAVLVTRVLSETGLGRRGPAV